MRFVDLETSFAGARAAHAVGVVVCIVSVKLLLRGVIIVIVVSGDCVLDAVRKPIAIERVGHVHIFGDGGEEALVDGLAGVGLLNHTQDAIVKMLVEFLRVGKGDRAGGAGASHLLCTSIGLASAWRLLAAVWRILFDTVNGSEMALENVRAVERLFSSRARSRTEAAHHGALVMRQCVSVLVVFPREAFEVVLARRDRTLLRSLGLVSKHVRFQILENATTLGKRAETLLSGLIVNLEAASALAAAS